MLSNLNQLHTEILYDGLTISSVDLERERRDGDREFRGREDGEDKTLGDWRRKEEGGGRDRRGLCYFCAPLKIMYTRVINQVQLPLINK